MEAKIILNYIFENEEPDFLKIIIEKKEYKLEDMNKKEILIKFNDIEVELGSKIIEIEFKYINIPETHYCEISPGNNYGILFPFKGYTRDIIFPEDQTYKAEIQRKYDKEVLEIKNSRLLLINYNPCYNLIINGKIFSNEIMDNAMNNSLQICIADLNKRFLFKKAINPINFDEFFEIYKKYNDDAINFFNKIQHLMGVNLFSEEQYKSLFNEKKLTDILFIKFNLPKVILKNEYNKKEYFDFISSCCLYYILSSIHEEKKIKQIYQYFIKFKEQLEKDSNLEIYLKNMIMIEFSYLLESKKNLDNFKKINFSYYITKLLEKDSPLYNALQFLEKFIETLNEKSPFIYPLILIDSGNFIFNNKNVYGFGLISKDNLKSHLKNILPDVIIIIDDNEEKNNHEQSNPNKVIGSIVLNLFSRILSFLKNVKLDKKIKEKDNNNITLILLTEILHKLFGCQKDEYSQETNKPLITPIVFYDKNKKKLLTLINRDSLFHFSEEIKILRDDAHDSGYLLEYYMGECEYGYYSELIEKMIIGQVNLNLILDNKLLNGKIEVIRRYLKLKYIIFKFDRNSLPIKEYDNIYEEIVALEKIIKEKNIKLNIIKQNEEENRKRIEINLSDYRIQKDIERFEKLSYDEMREKMNSDETPPELRKILFKVLMKRIRRK